MAKKKGVIEKVMFQCETCKRRNYSMSINKKKNTGRLELSKYCSFDRKHTVHKEMK